MVYYWKKPFIKNLRNSWKKVHNTEQLVPRITESKDIHVVGRWLRICTHISYDYLSHAASKNTKSLQEKTWSIFLFTWSPLPLWSSVLSLSCAWGDRVGKSCHAHINLPPETLKRSLTKTEHAHINLPPETLKKSLTKTEQEQQDTELLGYCFTKSNWITT